MAIQVTASTLNIVYQSVRKLILQGMEAGEGEVWSKDLYFTTTSTTLQEIYAFLASLSPFRKWVGARQIEHLGERGFSLINEKYEKTIAIKRDHIEDNTLGMYAQWSMLLGRQAAKLVDDLMKPLVQTGGTGMTFRGTGFYSDSHPVNIDRPELGMFTNDHTGLPLTFENVRRVREYIMSIKGEDGRERGLMPTTLIVPPTLETQAKEIVANNNRAVLTINGGTLSTSSAITSTTITNVLAGTMVPKVVPEFANDPTTWYVASLNYMGGIIKPFLLQLRSPMEIVAVTDATSENMFMREELLIGGRTRLAVAGVFPELFHRCRA